VSTVAGQDASYASPVTVTSYDLAGRAVSTADCEPTATGGCGTVLRTGTSAFDGAGRLLQTTSAQGRITTYGYDAAGLLTTVGQRQDPLAPASTVTVTLGYDANGNNTRVVDGNGHATVYTYTPWNRPESTIEPATAADPNPADRTWTTVYDAAGQPVQERLPGGVNRNRTFDNLGRLIAETATGTPTATTARELDYDPLGRVTSATSPAGNQTYTWNDRGLLARATGYGGGATYQYDADGYLVSRQDPSGQATFGYDAAGRLTSTVDPLTTTTASTAYDAAGRIQAIDLGTGHAGRAYTYDPLGRTATDKTTRPDGSVSVSATYGYDLDDLPTTKVTSGVAGAGETATPTTASVG
jgi:YD repeat-containing protein